MRRTYSDTHLHLIQSEGLSGKTLPQPFLPQPFLPPHPHCRAAHTKKADEASQETALASPRSTQWAGHPGALLCLMLLLMTTSLPESPNL